MHVSVHLCVVEPTYTPVSKGRYSHASSVVNGNLLIISGGFRGNVLGDLWAYQVLSALSLNTVSICVCGEYDPVFVACSMGVHYHWRLVAIPPPQIRQTTPKHEKFKKLIYRGFRGCWVRKGHLFCAHQTTISLCFGLIFDPVNRNGSNFQKYTPLSCLLW